jgi:uncharacterized protein YqjF (DUF2071 family)
VSAFGSLATSVRQAHVADDVSHRPWPTPEAPWAQAQTLEDVLLVHWRVEEAALARLLPPELAVDVFGGEAWLGILAFQVTNARLRGLPPLPGLSSFAELNVRTYVSLDGRPGVWFFSLDLGNALAVEAMKRLYRLPARRARIDASQGRYELVRPDAAFKVRYRGAGEPFEASPGTLEAFLAERFCAYTADGGRLYRAELHHPPWRLRRGEATIEASTIAPVALGAGEPHLLVAASQDLLVWALEEL